MSSTAKKDKPQVVDLRYAFGSLSNSEKAVPTEPEYAENSNGTPSPSSIANTAAVEVIFDLSDPDASACETDELSACSLSSAASSQEWSSEDDEYDESDDDNVPEEELWAFGNSDSNLPPASSPSSRRSSRRSRRSVQRRSSRSDNEHFRPNVQPAAAAATTKEEKPPKASASFHPVSGEASGKASSQPPVAALKSKLVSFLRAEIQEKDALLSARDTEISNIEAEIQKLEAEIAAVKVRSFQNNS